MKKYYSKNIILKVYIYLIQNNLIIKKKLPRQNLAFAGMPCLHVLECHGPVPNH